MNSLRGLATSFPQLSVKPRKPTEAPNLKHFEMRRKPRKPAGAPNLKHFEMRLDQNHFEMRLKKLWSRLHDELDEHEASSSMTEPHDGAAPQASGAACF